MVVWASVRVGGCGVADRLDVIGLPDVAAGPIEQRDRGFGAGELLVGMASAQLAGQDFLVGLDRVRADTAGTGAVAGAGTGCDHREDLVSLPASRSSDERRRTDAVSAVRRMPDFDCRNTLQALVGSPFLPPGRWPPLPDLPVALRAQRPCFVRHSRVVNSWQSSGSGTR